MNLKDLIEKEANEQVKKLAEMEKRLNRQALAMQRELYQIIKDRFLDSLQRDTKGNLLYNTTNLNRVNDMVKTWDYFRENQFRPEVLNFGKDLLSIVDVEAGYFLALGKEFNIPFEFDKVRELISKQVGITLDKSPSIIQGSYLDRLLQGAPVQDKVTNVILENVSSKSSMARLKEDLSTLIMGNEDVNGAMTKYLNTYATDTFSVVQRSIDLNLADTYGLTCFVYEGNIIKDTRDFCRDNLGRVICQEDIEEIEAQDWAGKNPDIPFVVSLGGYNCRHTAMWIPDEAKEYFNEEQKTVDEEKIAKETIQDEWNKLDKMTFDEQRKFLINEIENNGYWAETGGTAVTDYGNSYYLRIIMPKDTNFDKWYDVFGGEAIKIRISDHSVENVSRMANELHNPKSWKQIENYINERWKLPLKLKELNMPSYEFWRLSPEERIKLLD